MCAESLTMFCVVFTEDASNQCSLFVDGDS